VPILETFCKWQAVIAGRVRAVSYIPCRSPAVPLPCRSAKVLDCVFPIWFTQCGRVWFTHAIPFPCRSPAMPRISLSESDLSRPWQVRGMVAAAGWWHVDGMFSTCQLTASCRYHTQFQEVFYQKHTNLRCSGQCETERRLSWTKISLLFWCNDMSACIIYRTKIMITV
jgi:hypothetical protein